MKKQPAKKSGPARRDTPAKARAGGKTAPAAVTPIPHDTHHHIPWWRAVRDLGIAVVIAAATWTVCAAAFGVVRIGDTLASARMPDSALEQIVETQAAQYRLRLYRPDGQAGSFTLHEAGIGVDAHATVRHFRSTERGVLHIVSWWQPQRMELVTRTDNRVLSTFIGEHARVVATPPRNAGISLDGGKVAITPETNGTGYGFTNPAGAITAAARTLQGPPLRLAPISLKPQLDARALTAAKTRLEHILQQRITITIGQDTVTPDAKDIAGWLTLTPANTDVQITVNTAALQRYLDELASSHTTPARSQVISDTTGTVLVAGRKGVRVGGTHDASATLAGSVLDAKGEAISLPVTLTAYKTLQAPTAGKWIEVDTTTKRMYAYDQGEIVHSFLVTAGAPATPTVTGRYAIYAKYRSQDMFGENADGSTYFQPNVPYINYFYRDYAIHGNYWRPAGYFGNVNSSHGCVGITVSDGAWMYAWAPVGTPVIVHT